MDKLQFLVLITVICHTHTHTFNGPFSGTIQVSQYQKGKTNLDFTEAIDSEWQWHQLGHMLSAGSYASLHIAPGRQPHQHPPLCFLQAGCPSCHPTNSVKALKAQQLYVVICHFGVKAGIWRVNFAIFLCEFSMKLGIFVNTLREIAPSSPWITYFQLYPWALLACQISFGIVYSHSSLKCHNFDQIL